jgi:hypothetical protein
VNSFSMSPTGSAQSLVRQARSSVSLPAALVRGFGWATLGLLAAGTALFVLAAALVFRRGLVRYASGNRFGVRS